jgi:serine/threonine-protein kinase
VSREPHELPTVPTHFGEYEVVARVAAGGMAEVYAARSRDPQGIDKLVAIKRLLEHLVDEQRFIEMFLDEARIAANIHSPHCVETLDLGRAEDGLPYLVMELVVGAPLSRLAARIDGPWPVPMVATLLAEAADGLHAAHEARDANGTELQIVHRDVSPQNVLVGIDGRVRIADFGVARAVMRITKTKTGQIKGKIGYFSPEQAMSSAIDRRSDIFSLGIIAWELLAGRRLFRAKQLLDVYKKIVQEDAPPLLEVAPHVPPGLAEAVMCALARDPNDRFQDAASFADALRAGALEAGRRPTSDEISDFVWQYAGEQVGALVRAIERSDTGFNRADTRAMLQLPESRDALIDLPTDEQATRINERTDAGSDSASHPVLFAAKSNAPASGVEFAAPPASAPQPAAPAKTGVFERVAGWFARLFGG